MGAQSTIYEKESSIPRSSTSNDLILNDQIFLFRDEQFYVTKKILEDTLNSSSKITSINHYLGLCFIAAKPVKKVTGKIISKFANKLENKIEFSSHFIIYLAPRNAKEIFNKFISASIIIFKAAQNTEYYLLKNIEKAVK